MGAELSPKYWRAKAGETRILADGMRHRRSKEALIRIAEGYERLAKTAEELSRKSRASPSVGLRAEPGATSGVRIAQTPNIGRLR